MPCTRSFADDAVSSFMQLLHMLFLHAFLMSPEHLVLASGDVLPVKIALETYHIPG